MMNFDQAILNIGMSRENKQGDPAKNDVLYSRWSKRHANTISEFYYDFIEPRLPKPEIVRKWHEVLLEYTKRENAIFPIRDGYSNDENHNEKLRRGWLVRVDDHLDYEGKFSYMFTDNCLASYIYKMALDEYCPTVDEFFEYMTEFKQAKDIVWLNGKIDKIRNLTDVYHGERRFLSMPVHFGKIGKPSYPGSTETEKNAYINVSPAPSCPLGTYGYKHSHIFAVKGVYSINKDDVSWKNLPLIELGEETTSQKDYQWDDTIKNYVWKRKMNNSTERDELRKIIVAHFLRFLDPMNHFLSPMAGSNKFTTCDNEYSLDIAEYNNLISYMIFVRENQFGKDFVDFKTEALPASTTMAADTSSEIIDIIYHEDKKEAASKKNKHDSAIAKAAKLPKRSSKKTTSTVSVISKKLSNSDLTYEIAAYYLRHTESMSTVGTKLLPTPDKNGSKTKSRLTRLGILGQHKGLLISSNIDDEIAKSTGELKASLEEIKRRGL